MSDTPLDPNLNALEAGLRALAPRTPAINRDRLLFLAGRASGNRRTAGWRAWAVGSTLAAAGLGAALGFRPPPQRVEVEVVRWLPAPVEERDSTLGPAAASSSSAVLASPQFDGRREPYGQMQLRRLAFDYGVDALPQTTAAESDSKLPATADDLRSAVSPIWWR